MLAALLSPAGVKDSYPPTFFAFISKILSGTFTFDVPEASTADLTYSPKRATSKSDSMAGTEIERAILPYFSGLFCVISRLFAKPLIAPSPLPDWISLTVFNVPSSF